MVEAMGRNVTWIQTGVDHDGHHKISGLEPLKMSKKGWDKIHMMPELGTATRRS